MKKYIVLLVILLSGCNDEKKPANVLLVPALPVVQSVVMSLAPMINGGRNEALVAQLCNFVNGGEAQEKITNFLTELNIAAEKNEGLALFTEGKSADRIIACAAFIASSVLIEPNFNEFIGQDKELEGLSLEERKYHIDREQLAAALAVKLAVAQANADVFALISSNLKANLTLDEYRLEITRLFKLLAPTYLERVKSHYQGKVNFSVLQMQKDNFIFTSSTGYRFEFNQQGLTLKLLGINWYGNGQLLGNDYNLAMAYFPQNMVERLK